LHVALFSLPVRSSDGIMADNTDASLFSTLHPYLLRFFSFAASSSHLRSPYFLFLRLLLSFWLSAVGSPEEIDDFFYFRLDLFSFLLFAGYFSF
jgi:hypothetical protein